PDKVALRVAGQVRRQDGLAAAQVLGQTILTTYLPSHTQSYLVFDDGHVYCAFNRAVVLGAISATNIATELVARSLRGNNDGTAERVATEQRALRAFQYLHVGDIVSRDIRARARQCHVGEISHNGRHAISERNARKAAHDDVVGSLATFGAETKAGHDDVQILNVAHAALVERFGRE